LPCIDDDVLAAYFELRLDPDATNRLFAHLDGCARCERLFAAVAAAHTGNIASAPTVPGGAALVGLKANIGRYRVERIIGAGGMGVVYEAHDPELDRRIAIKLLRPDSRVPAEELRNRLTREARAMARLSHPNVINVYEIGTYGEQVFVVMELVDGCTLSAWLREAPRSWREIARVFVAAGEGLAAAHAQGVVHRDFKPDNVLISRDGRICVTDFGLARLEREGEAGEATAATASPAGSVTYSGRLAGTPGFMAPEQMRGEPTDARSDLFSFCAAMYGALYETPPYAGHNLTELIATTECGKLEPPRRAVGPSEYRRALTRGLAPRPDDRPRAMAELLAVLRVDPIARRRRRLLAGAALVVVAGVGLVVVKQQRRIQACRGADARLAGIWDAARKARIRDALTAAGAPSSVPAVAAKLDEFAGAWVTMSTQACEAQLRGSESAALFDRRTRCLDDRMSELRAATDLLATADQQVATHAVALVGALPELERCADSTHLLISDVDPPRPSERAEYDRLRDGISHLMALEVAGKTDEQNALASALMEEARRFGNLSLQAEAEWMRGVAALRRGRNDEALAAMHRAALSAERVRNDDLVHRAWEYVAYLDLVQGRLEEGVSWAHYADAVAERLKLSGALRSFTLSYGVVMLARLGRNDEALAEARQALALAAQRPANDGQALRAEQARSNLATALFDLGHFAEALPIEREIYERDVRQRGRDHPSTIGDESDLASSLAEMGRFAEALPLAEEAMALAEKRFGPMNETGDALHVLGTVEEGLHRLDKAHDHLQRALAIYEHNTVEGVQLAGTLLHLGKVERARGQAGAPARLERALSVGAAAKLGPLSLAPMRFALAEALQPEARARALELATLARDAYLAAAKTGADQAGAEGERVAAWLRRHGGDGVGGRVQ
jgi:tetratricopeptide (TPR) repeat protein